MMIELLQKIALESWIVLGQMSPYLLLGFLVAGVLSVCISAAWIERHLGGQGLGPVVKASVFGVPLPLCSCGVIPVSASIRRHGASSGATASFLLSTPQTGVDSIAVTYALLGPIFAVVRPVVALVTGIFGGMLVNGFAKADVTEAAQEAEQPAKATCTEPCCATDGSQSVILRALHYGFVTLPRDIGWSLLVGVLIAGLLTALVPPGQLKPYLGSGLGSILLMILAGVPVYVCATASVPIAAGLIHLGASPGAALAFLIAGPATNAATFTTIWKVLGRRTAIVYLGVVAVSAVAGGSLLDAIPALGQGIPEFVADMHHAEAVGLATHLWTIALLGVLAVSIFRPWLGQRGARQGEPTAAESGALSGRERVVLRVDGMTCSHCAESVRRALSECEGVESAEVDLPARRAVVVGRNVDRELLAEAAIQSGYRATPMD